ncbi:MAG: BBP7 family outer membrane beta-barrel protein [Planctomycetaceae bacterium]
MTFPSVSLTAVLLAALLMACGSSQAWGGDTLSPAMAEHGAPPAETMYVTDPFSGDAFAAMPAGLGDSLAPTWPRWFAGAGGLVMTRTLPGGSATMQPVTAGQLSTADAGANWSGGVDLHIGRWFGMRQQHAVEFLYWGVYELGGSARETSSPGSIDAIPQAPGAMVAGQPAVAVLTNLTAQQINRSDVINDVEINWIYSLWDRPEFLPRERSVSLMWLVGFRFFEVSDQLTLQNGKGQPSTGVVDFSAATNNNVFGAQVGAKFDWRLLPRVRVNIVPKFMIGGNAISNTSVLEQESGTYATFVTDGSPVKVHSTLGVFSWLGSIDSGLAWDVNDAWSLWLGYRVVGVGNVAQADGQWPTMISTPASLSGIAAGSSTIVHGGFAGFEGRY